MGKDAVLKVLVNGMGNQKKYEGPRRAVLGDHSGPAMNPSSWCLRAVALPLQRGQDANESKMFEKTSEILSTTLQQEGQFGVHTHGSFLLVKWMDSFPFFVQLSVRF